MEKTIKNDIETEKYLCSFELSSLLKKLGLNLHGYSLGWHGIFGHDIVGIYGFLGEYQYITDCLIRNNAEFRIQRPSHDIAKEWLLVNFDCQIFIDYTFNDGFNYYYKWVKNNGDYGMSTQTYNTTYDATENGLIFLCEMFLKNV